jgi:streptogramin lyase
MLSHVRLARFLALCSLLVLLANGLAACGGTDSPKPPTASCGAEQLAHKGGTTSMAVYAWTLHCYQGQSITASVATLNDVPSGTKASDVQATIDWGDATPPATTSGTNSCAGQSTGAFSVCGTHKYAQARVYSIAVAITLRDVNGAAGATVAHSAAVILAAPCHATFLEWNMSCDIADAEGLVVSDVSLGSRYMAKRMGVGYLQLKTSGFERVRYIHLGPDTDEYSPDGSSAGHSRLMRLPTITDAPSPGPGHPGALAITAVYRVDLAWPATPTSSWLEVIQQYAFYSVIDENAKQNPSDPNSPWLYVACEPTRNAAPIEQGTLLGRCGRWKPLVAYSFHPGVDQSGNVDALQTITVAERWNFTPDKKSVKGTTFIHDCQIGEGPAQPTNQQCLRVPGFSTDTVPGLAAYAGANLVSDQATAIQTAAIIHAVEAIHGEDGWNSQMGEYDNLHLTPQDTVGLPIRPPGCEECVHIHWRWGLDTTRVYTPSGSSSLPFDAQVFGLGHPLLGCLPNGGSWDGTTAPDDGRLLCLAEPWIASPTTSQDIDVALVANQAQTANDVRRDLLPGCCTAPQGATLPEGYGNDTTQPLQGTSPVVWYVVTATPNTGNPETADVLFAGGGFFDCQRCQSAPPSSATPTAMPTPTPPPIPTTAAPSGTVTRFALNPGSYPTSIAVGPDHHLWITEPGTHQIARVTPSAGEITPGDITHFPVPNNGGPYAIDAGPDGALWYTDPALDAIGRMTPTGAVTTFPLPSPMFNSLRGITAGPDGNLWFTEMFAGKIGRITPGGSIAEFPLPTPNYRPYAITAGPDGNLWFLAENGDQTSRTGGLIGRVTPAGQITPFPLPTAGDPQVAGPETADEITAGPDGNLWFTEMFAGKIGRITPGGSIAEFAIPTAGSEPEGITGGPDGNLWFTERTRSQIGRIAPNGTVTEFPLDSPSLDRPGAIIAGPDGNLWFTTINNEIGRITP